MASNAVSSALLSTALLISGSTDVGLNGALWRGGGGGGGGEWRRASRLLAWCARSAAADAAAAAAAAAVRCWGPLASLRPCV